MAEHFADRLLGAIEKTAPVCVGLDPLYEQLPAALRTEGADEGQRLAAVETFCRGVLEAVTGIVPAVKPQSAYFELYRERGVKLYFQLVRLARKAGLIVIGDVKRGDIGPTASAYAAGHLGHAAAPDAVTVSAYFGADGVEPFLQAARAAGAGVFVLVRTSNPSAGAVQDFADATGRRFYEHLAAQVAALGEAPGLVGAPDTVAWARWSGRRIPPRHGACARSCRRRCSWCPGTGPRALGGRLRRGVQGRRHGRDRERQPLGDLRPCHPRSGQGLEAGRRPRRQGLR